MDIFVEVITYPDEELGIFRQMYEAILLGVRDEEEISNKMILHGAVPAVVPST